MQAPVCEKLFKISSKFEPGQSSNKRLKSRMKPSRYSGTSSKIEEKHLDEPNDEKKYHNEDDKDNEKEHTDDVKLNDVDIETEREEIVGNEKNLDENSSAKNSVEKKLSPKRPLKDRGNPKHQRVQGKVKKILENREKAKHVIDLLHQLSDYQTDNDYKREKLKSYTELKNDPLLELSDYQTAEEGEGQ